jgi:hypothetical protein
MSTQKPILDHSTLKRRLALNPSQNADASSPQQCAASRIDAVIAVIHSDLRARSAETNELLKRSLATVSNTMDMIACSQEAIARSRVLLDRARGPIAQNRPQIVAGINKPEKGAMNTESPFSNVGYIFAVRESPPVIHLLLLNQHKICQISHNV